MGQLFNVIFYQPIFNTLVFIYNFLPGHDIGLAIVILTVIIKLILYPFSLQSIKSQKALNDLQPKIEELKRKHKDQKEVLAKEMMEMYRREKINPMSSCLPVLIQFPFLIAVFQVFRDGLGAASLKSLYSFVYNPGMLNPVSLGLVDLSRPQAVLAVLAGAAQFWQTKMLMTKKPPKQVLGQEGTKDESLTAAINKQMLYIMPVITVFIGLTLPGGLSLYWLIITLLSVLQQHYLFRKDKKKDGLAVS